MSQSILSHLFNARLLSLIVSIFLIFISIIGPPDTQIFALIISLNFTELVSIYKASESFFRMPDSINRLIVFSLAIIFLILSAKFPPIKNNENKLGNISFTILYSILFLTILLTDNLYNIVVLIMFVLSIHHFIFYAKNRFENKEIFLLLSFLLFFSYPFFHSYIFISSSITEADNYTRFLLGIPLYLMIREMNYRRDYFLYIINISALILFPVSFFFYIIQDLERARIFTSSSSIFGNISIVYFLFSVLSMYYFKKYKLKYPILPILASISSLLAWSLSGARFSILIVILFFLLLVIHPTYRKNIADFFNLKGLIYLLVILLVFISSNSFERLSNISMSSFSDFNNPQSNYWKKDDDITPRLLIWTGTINMIKENTMQGVGLDNFNNELYQQIVNKKIQPIRKDLDNPTAGFNHAHSQYLDIFAKLGIVGFMLLINLIIANIYFFKRLANETDNNVFSVFGMLFIIFHIFIMINHVIISHHQSTIFMVMLLMFFAGMSMSSKQRKVDQ